ncbi:MAG: hypothetical protein Q8P41_09305 [Pseudomonadota bacterium]|nr:hypothetical protein [Pseudomonadota bacterium]
MATRRTNRSNDDREHGDTLELDEPPNYDDYISESPVEAGSHADAEGLDGMQYITGEVPYQTQEEILLEQERTEVHEEDDRDWEAPEEVVAERVAFDERDDVNIIPDVDRQGRRGEEERDWQGDPFADSGRDRPSDGSRKRRH